MEHNDVLVRQEQIDLFKSRGYTNDDILPNKPEQRSMSTLNFFTLWMGSVHNIPNYLTVGGFLALGVAPIHVFLAIILAGLAVAGLMTVNGKAGSMYGIPFAIHLRSVYGSAGSKLPGFLRGVVAAIAWFGVQNYAGSKALLILVSRIWPAFLNVGEGINILGLSVPAFLSFVVFFLINVMIGLGGGRVLNKFTAILNPLIYVVFGGMVVWGLSVAGGFGPIFDHVTAVNQSVATPLAYLIIIASTLSVWAAPGVSVSDFTQNATSTKSQTIGQILSLLVGYVIFAFASITVLNGAAITGVSHQGDVLQIINQWDSMPAIFLASFVLLMTTVSTNATGNIIPAAFQLTALFPQKINYRKGVIIASIISFIIMPWKFMESGSVILVFLNYIGSLLGPVAGVMIAHFYFVDKQKIDLDLLYYSPEQAADNPYSGVNKKAYIATICGFVVSIVGQFIPALEFLSQISWIDGFVVGLLVYFVLNRAE
ncbi:allantoin permease [Facklamia sp. P12945]|uniref:allantoin permease n=1 Tax=unclassified Facklamia TaxID=2622293 RepID=UPI003D1760FC